MASDYQKFRLWKNGEVVTALRVGAPFYQRAKQAYEPLEESRIFAVDTESLTVAGNITTLLTPIRFHDEDVMIETLDGEEMFPKLLREISRKYEIPEGTPSDTTQRPKEPRAKRLGKKNGRDGRRMRVPPCLAVFFNLPYDFGRLTADMPDLLRCVAAGADSFRHRVTSDLEIEISKMHFGSSSSFEWFVRRKDPETGERFITRILGIDLRGYWKTSLAEAAKAVGGTAKIDIESVIERVYEKPFEEFTADEWQKFREYAGVDAQTTLELYHATVSLLVTIDARVVMRTGVIPQSAPGAAAKVMFQKAFDQHPEIEKWWRYPDWADQLGCEAYYGGRSFCTEPGVHEGMTTLDLKSAYPFQLALLPDPVTVQMTRVEAVDCRSPQGFDVEKFKGKYGVLRISGESLDDVHPAFRIHGENGKLQYVYGAFEHIAVTIPEIVIGVLSGVLRVDSIDEGVIMEGSPEKSFLRAGVRDFFAIKEDKKNDKALRDMAKLLMNATYGKLIEVNATNFLVSEEMRTPVFVEHQKAARSLVKIYADEKPKYSELYWGPTPGPAQSRFWKMMDEVGKNASKVEILGCYLATLEEFAPRDGDKMMKLGEFVRSARSYKCGTYFMPLYAAQVTGATSAMLGLMARVLGALQGDTDSVHAKGITERRKDRYFEVMAEAGYPSPRKVDGEWIGGIDVEGLGSLGSWEEESPSPSVESVLVRSKVYSHAFGDGSYKQAKHGFSKFHSEEIESALRDGGMSREERGKKAKEIRYRTLHEAMARLERGETVVYETRKSPRLLREAVISGKAVGEFVSRLVELRNERDENTWVGVDGVLRWKTFGWQEVSLDFSRAALEATGPPSLAAE